MRGMNLISFLCRSACVALLPAAPLLLPALSANAAERTNNLEQHFKPPTAAWPATTD